MIPAAVHRGGATLPVEGLVALQNVTGASSETAGTEFTLQNVLTAIVVLVIAYVLAGTLSLVLSKLADRLAHQRFRVMFLIPIVKFFVYGGALYLVPIQLAFAGFQIRVDRSEMVRMEPFGHQYREPLGDQLFGFVAEHPLDRLIRVEDSAVLVDGDDRVGAVLDE